MSVHDERDIKKKVSEVAKKMLPYDLPIGVYLVSKEGYFVGCNSRAREILKLPQNEDELNANINDFYCDPGEGIRLRKELENAEAKGRFLEKKVILFEVDGQEIWVQDYCRSIKDPDTGKLIGYTGCLVDVTEEENYRQLRDTIPVGTYMVKRNERGKEVIWQCNKAFADMFEYEIEEIKGREVKELYEKEKDYEDFKKEIEEKRKQNKITWSTPIKAKTSKGRLMILDVHYRLLTDKDGNILGRAGIVFDISNEVALRDLRDDIGKILHFYSAALVTLDQSIKPILNALGPAPFEIGEMLTIAKASEALIEPAKNLKNVLGKMMEMRNESGERQGALPGGDWGTLENQMHLLDTYREQIFYPEFQLSTLHDLSRIVLDISAKIEKGKLPRELTRDFLNKAKELERICCLIRTHQALDTIIEVDYSIRALREFVIFQQRQPDPSTICTISSLIQNAVYQLILFARHRKVKIEQDYQSCLAKVSVDERSVLRALSNLLYNAIKYSWFRESGERPWVTVKAFTVENEVHVEFQNYGVPITKKEIENELIFKFGYRGKYSGDRRRLGTGVGLTDARDTARKHGGDVKIKSHPASEGDETDYNRPFITTATFILPIHGQ